MQVASPFAPRPTPPPLPGRGRWLRPRCKRRDSCQNDRNDTPHHRLDAYCVALELVAAANRVAASIRRGQRPLADQLKRASTSTVLLIAEGANRRTAGDKRQRFSIARGECGEVAAATQVAMTLKLVPRDEAQRVMVLAARVAAMLTRLIQRFS